MKTICVCDQQGNEFEIMTEMWPVLQGQERAEAAYANALATTQPPSVDIVARPELLRIPVFLGLVIG